MNQPKIPLLLTPGPLTTADATKEAMLRDWGSRDAEFIAMNARVRARLLELVHGEGSHVCVPLQGSGTFIVEAAIGTLVGPTDRLLVLVERTERARPLGRAQGAAFLEAPPDERPGRLVIEQQRPLLADQECRRGDARQQIPREDQFERFLDTHACTLMTFRTRR